MRVLCDADRKPIALGAKLGEGGEGAVFALRDDASLCAKIYHPHLASERAQKLEAMVASPPKDHENGHGHASITWPTSLVFESERSFAGFVMPRVRGMTVLHRYLTPDSRMMIAAWFDWRRLHRLCGNMAHALSAIHDAGHCVGDLNENNVLVSPKALATFVDADSMQIASLGRSEPFRCEVFREEYLAPELIGKDLAHVDRTPGSDNFALAVLVFRTLALGAHPHDGVLTGAHLRIPERIAQQVTPLLWHRRIRFAPGVVSDQMLHPHLVSLFRACFGASTPNLRPTAAEWAAGLNSVESMLVTCGKNRNHVHIASTRCPWCQRAQDTGIDAFPDGTDWQVAALADLDALDSASDPTRVDWFRRHVRSRISDRRLSKREHGWLLEVGLDLRIGAARIGKLVAEELRRVGATSEVALTGKAPAKRSNRVSPLARLQRPRIWARTLPQFPSRTPQINWQQPLLSRNLTLARLLVAAVLLALLVLPELVVRCASRDSPIGTRGLSNDTGGVVVLERGRSGRSYPWATPNDTRPTNRWP